MSPIPQPSASHDLPKFHLQILDLSHPGTEKFFSNCGTPLKLLESSASAVLRWLYPLSARSFKTPTSATSLAEQETADNQVPEAHPPSIRSVTLHVRSVDGVAYTQSIPLDSEHKEVHFSADYVHGIDSARIGNEIRGVIVHELVHVFQYDGKAASKELPIGSEPRSNSILPIGEEAKAHSGMKDTRQVPLMQLWRYWTTHVQRIRVQTTAYFFLWLEKRFDNPWFVPQLNALMAEHEWDTGKWLRELLQGQDIEDLWAKYKRSLGDTDRQSDSTASKPVPTHGC